MTSLQEVRDNDDAATRAQEEEAERRAARVILHKSLTLAACLVVLMVGMCLLHDAPFFHRNPIPTDTWDPFHGYLRNGNHGWARWVPKHCD